MVQRYNMTPTVMRPARGLTYISTRTSGPFEPYMLSPDPSASLIDICICIRVKGEIIPTCNFRPGAKRPYFEEGYYVGKSIYPALSPFGRLRNCVFRKTEPRALIEEI